MASEMADLGLMPGEKALYAAAVVLLVLGAGLMSGLTLGLLSLDVMDLEVLKAAGTPKQRTSAARLISLVTRPHWLLCTLLLCNAACMEALPLFLDRLLNPMAAVLLSITAILLFGEIIPQAVCSRYGVVIGACFAPTVKALMWLCAPVSWPLGKVLDWVLGHEETAMERKELKAMVQLHTPEAGFGGALTSDEVAVIHGALDLSHKNAATAMTPLDEVFMLSDEAVLDKQLIQQVLNSGHSRLPVYRGNDRSDICGLVLVKELLQFWQCEVPPAVSQLRRRTLPRIPADTPLFDVLKLFQAGNSHMALLLAPAGCTIGRLNVSACNFCCSTCIGAMVDASEGQHTGLPHTESLSKHSAGSVCSSDTELGDRYSSSSSSSNSSSPPQAGWTNSDNRGSTSSSSSSSSSSCQSHCRDGCSSTAAEEQTVTDTECLCLSSTKCGVLLPMHGNSRSSSSSSSSDCRQKGISNLLGRVRSSTKQRHVHHQQQGYVALDMGQLPVDKLVPRVAGPVMAYDGCCSSALHDSSISSISSISSSSSSVKLVPVGIITLEDVVEELLQVEIFDETDTHPDNVQTWRIGSRGSVTSSLAHMKTAAGAQLIRAKSRSEQTPATPVVRQLSRPGVLGRPLATLCRMNTEARKHAASWSLSAAEAHPGARDVTVLLGTAPTGGTSRRASA